MSYKHNILKERFDLEVSTANSTIKGEWELDKNANILFGVAVTSDNEELIYYRGTQKMQVNDQELFPEEFETKLLMSGLSVAPNQRMVKVGNVETGNNRVEVWYKDQDHPKTRFVPYRITFYFFSKVK
ncbi:MAG: hypothetical protein MK086_14235 [Flavobacteriales bacterium]|nr:hypothetical protein [Flavobacteriales bacterium]